MLTARMLLAGFDSVYLIALGVWLGMMAFFSFGIAPIIFKVLDAQSAAKFVRAVFPRYYAWGAYCGAIALPAALCGPLTFPEYRGAWVGVQALLIGAATLTMFYCGQSLTPAINKARDEGEAGKERFHRSHRLSVWLNGVVMIIVIGLTIAHAARPAARTRGIVELSPVERSKRELKAIADKERLLERTEKESKPSAEGVKK